MASLNRVFLVGNLTRDPEVRYTPSGAAVADALANYITGGSVSEAGWAWTPGARIYFDNLGMLTDTAPALGHHRSVGVADTATSVLVNVGEVIAR